MKGGSWGSQVPNRVKSIFRCDKCVVCPAGQGEFGFVSSLEDSGYIIYFQSGQVLIRSKGFGIDLRGYWIMD